MIKHIQFDTVPDAGAPFSQAVVDGTYVHMAGLVAADFPEGKDVLGQVGLETTAVMNALQKMLAQLKLDMERIVRVDVHLADLADFDEMDAAYRRFFCPGKFPARTTTHSSQLFGGSKVEITCMARLNIQATNHVTDE